MAILSNLKPSPGSKHGTKRVGRGRSSGMGKTSTRGHKGQNSRSGGGVRRGFEGGQMPLYRRSPKWGFNNKNHENAFNYVNLDTLSHYFNEGEEVTLEICLERGIVRNRRALLKVLGRGELKKGLKVSAHKFSSTAAKAITDAKGSVTEIKFSQPEVEVTASEKDS